MTLKRSISKSSSLLGLSKTIDRNSAKSRTVRPSTDKTLSPSCKPASAAAVSGITSPISAGMKAFPTAI